ncbi:MAG: pimeloyl-ACP methyl ester carboxylesterase [Halieaceae bacterium]|jgi:pimeloyl-ACP methyl ester carboxylesterase
MKRALQKKIVSIAALALFQIWALQALTVDAAESEPEPVQLEKLRETYANPASRFIDVDGVELHYTDEGSGFPVLLLHASYTNLESWRDVAAALKDNYRVIRLDFPAVGLSGIESRYPESGRLNLIQRNIAIVGKFIDRLSIDELNIIATSSGGSVGFGYASREPERVNRLVLINSAGMPRTRQTDPNRVRPDIQAWQKMRYKPREYWEYSVGRNFPSGTKPPEWFLKLVYDLNRRTPGADLARYAFTTGNPQEVLSRIRAPTLILWGEANLTVMHLEADVISLWMTSAPTLVKKYPNLGHYPYIEAPEVVIPDIINFLAGEMDSEMRQTLRADVPVNAK